MFIQLAKFRLPPLGREAAPYLFPPDRVAWFYDCFAAERGQAPSPQSVRLATVDRIETDTGSHPFLIE
ncbi:MAG TPA: hypothetical protein DIW52_13625 [Pseudomonas sp.]|nr:hypothetical protein [Pseudomonas sp.]